jgi:hypothetical protein
MNKYTLLAQLYDNAVYVNSTLFAFQSSDMPAWQPMIVAIASDMLSAGPIMHCAALVALCSCPGCYIREGLRQHQGNNNITRGPLQSAASGWQQPGNPNGCTALSSRQ